MATIAQIKQGLGFPVLNLQRATKNGEPTQWLRHWDNDSRVAVSIHEDTLKFAMENPNDDHFIPQKSELISESSNTPYISYRIVKITADIEATL